MFCALIVKQFLPKDFILVRLCCDPSKLILIKTEDSICKDTTGALQHIVIREIRKHRVYVKDHFLAYALEAKATNQPDCISSKAPSEKYTLPEPKKDASLSVLEFLLSLKGYVIGELRSSKHTNLYHFFKYGQEMEDTKAKSREEDGKDMERVIITDASLLTNYTSGCLFAISRSTYITSYSFYHITSKSDFILLPLSPLLPFQQQQEQQKICQVLRPFRIVPPSQEVQVSSLFGHRTGDHCISGYIVGEYLLTNTTRNEMTILLGDLQGIATIALSIFPNNSPNHSEDHALLFLAPSEGNGYIRTRVYIKNAILRVDDLGQHALFYAPETTPNSFLHLEYWPATEYSLKIPFEWFSAYSTITTTTKRVIKFQFLLVKRLAEGLYNGVDRRGTGACIQTVHSESEELEMGVWYLGVGQVIRLPNQSHDGVLGILLSKHRRADPKKDRQVLLQMFALILSHIPLSNAFL